MDIAELGVKIDASQAKQGAQQASTAIKGVGDAAENTNKQLKATSLTLKTATNFLVGFFGAFAAVNVMRNAIRTTAQFEQSVADLSAITGATGKQLEYLSDAAKEFGASTTLSASQAAEAFKLVASAKPDLLENSAALKAVTRETITLAEAAGMDLPSAAMALGEALNQFSEGADQANRFINVLAAGAKYGASEIEFTAEALRKAGVVASNAGLSFEQTNAALQILASGGIKAQIAGTNLRGVLLSMTTKAKTEFNPSIVGMSQAFENLATANLSATEQADLFGRENVAAAQILIKNYKLLADMEQKLTGTATATEQAATRTDTFQGAVKELASAYEGLVLQITATDGSLKTIVETMAEFLRQITTGTKAWGDFWNRVGSNLADITSGDKVSAFEQLGHAVTEIEAKIENLQRHPTNDAFERQINVWREQIVELRDRMREIDQTRIAQGFSPMGGGGGPDYEYAAYGMVSLGKGGGKATEKTNEVTAAQKERTAALNEYRDSLIDAQKEDDLFFEKESLLLQLQQQGKISIDTYNEALDELLNKMTDVSAATDAQAAAQERVTMQYQSAIESLDYQLMTEEERLQESYDRRQFMIEDAFQNEVITWEKRNALISKIEQKHADDLAKSEQKRNAQALSASGTFFNSLMSLSQQKSKSLFDIAKAGAVATALVDTYASFTAALKGPPGPPWSYPIAAAALAAGLAKVQAIRSTQFGGAGGAGGIATGGAGGGGVIPQPVAPVPTEAPSQLGQLTGAQSAITIEFSGDLYGFDDYTRDRIIESIRDAVENQDVILISNNSRNAQEIANG